MKTVVRFRVEDMIKEINDGLKKFSDENNIKARLNLSKEKKHLLNLLLYILNKDEGFEKGRFGIYVRFAFPLVSGEFLGAGFTLYSDRYMIERPEIVDEIEDGPIVRPTMWINALPGFQLLDDANKAERFRIYSFLEDLGFEIWDNRYFPYIKYALNDNEYLLEEE